MLSSFSLRLTVLAAAVAAAAAACPSSEWQEYQNRCYWKSDYTLNGRSVAKICTEMFPGSKPATIHDLDTNAFIAQDLVNGQMAWLGLHRADTNAAWTWLDGSSLDFTIWHEGQPNAKGEACGSINWTTLGFWSDEDCDTYYKIFICQIDA